MKNSHDQKILTNEKGSMSLQYLGLFSLLLLVSFYTVAKNLESYRLVKERKYHYLCFKTLLSHFEKYNQQMVKSNQVITLNFFLQFNPKTGPAHQKIIEATKLYQELMTIHYYRKLLQEKNCSLLNRGSFGKNILYKRTKELMLTRDKFERAIPNQLAAWSYIWINPGQRITIGKILQGDTISVSFLTPTNPNKTFRYQVKRTTLPTLITERL